MVKAAGTGLLMDLDLHGTLDLSQERMDDNYVCEIPDVVSLADKSTKPGMSKVFLARDEFFVGLCSV